MRADPSTGITWPARPSFRVPRSALNRKAPPCKHPSSAAIYIPPRRSATEFRTGERGDDRSTENGIRRRGGAGRGVQWGGWGGRAGGGRRRGGVGDGVAGEPAARGGR